jgi:acetylornithine/succinyldiaminopimelate/putrescine aminotransferase
MRRELDVLEPWEHSTTSGANPLALVALEETVKYIKNHNVLENVAEVSAPLKRGLVDLPQTFSCVSNVRGVGLMLAFDLPTSIDVEMFLAVAKRHGLLMRGSRYGFGRTVKVRPPLIIAEDEVRELLARLHNALNDFEKETGK